MIPFPGWRTWPESALTVVPSQGSSLGSEDPRPTSCAALARLQQELQKDLTEAGERATNQAGTAAEAKTLCRHQENDFLTMCL